MRLTDSIGEYEIEVETVNGKNNKIGVCIHEDKKLTSMLEFEDYQIGMLAEFFSKVYNEIKILNQCDKESLVIGGYKDKSPIIFLNTKA